MMESFLDVEEFLRPEVLRHLQIIDGQTMRAAAELLEKNGWVRGHLASERRMCTIGAVNEFMCGTPWTDSQLANRALIRFGVWLKENGMLSQEILADLDKYIYPMYSAVFRWNDAAFDALEVITTLRKFADEMDPQHD